MIELATCIRCAACSAVAPRTFDVTRKGTRILRQPTDDAERTRVRVAALICPTRAIRGAE